jgi:hypothetical protein
MGEQFTADFTVPSPDTELRRLEPLVGGWRASDYSQDSVLGPGVPVSRTETYQWLDGSYFLVSTYETVFGNDQAQTGVMYWGYDSGAQRFRNIFFSNNGPFTEDGNRYEGQVRGHTLTFEGPARFQYQLDDKGKVEVNPDGTISVAWWLRDENGDWQPWMSNVFSRLDKE